MRYVENNPVRATSLYRPRISAGPVPAHIALANPTCYLDPAEPRAIEGWSGWLSGAMDAGIGDLIRECTVTGRPCGDETFVRELEKLTGRQLHRKEGTKARTQENPLPLDFGSGEP